MSSSENTRDSERVPTAGQVTGEVTVYEPMTILDLSDRGAQVETKFRLHLGSLHEFRLSLGERTVVVKGRIAHCQIGELQEGGTILYRTGIEFGQRVGPHYLRVVVVVASLLDERSY